MQRYNNSQPVPTRQPGRGVPPTRPDNVPLAPSLRQQSAIPQISMPPDPGGVSLEQIERFADYAMESGLFPDIKNKAQAVIQISYGSELGISAFASLRSIYILPPQWDAKKREFKGQGKIELSANLMQGLMERVGFQWEYAQLDDQGCVIHWWNKQGRYLGISSFFIHEAHKMGRENFSNWQKHTQDMLRARAVSRGARQFAPALLHGCYVEGEISDRDPIPESGVIEYNQQPLEAPQPQLTSEQAEERRKELLRHYHAGVKSGFAHLIPREIAGRFDYHQLAKAVIATSGSLANLDYIDLEQAVLDLERSLTDETGRVWLRDEIEHPAIDEMSAAESMEALAELWKTWVPKFPELPLIIRGCLHIAKEERKHFFTKQTSMSAAEQVRDQATPPDSETPNSEPLEVYDGEVPDDQHVTQDDQSGK